jgi:prevent-host-death family protein
MCYMSEMGRRPARVGVRELRQNLSVYLDRVKDGETLEVTEHGVPVAELRPRHEDPVSAIDRLIAEGRITPAKYSHKDLTLPPVMPGRPTSEILQEMRDEDER